MNKPKESAASGVTSSANALIGRLCLLELVAWGVLYYAFSAFMPYMEAELGWGATVFAAGLSTAMLISGLSAPAVGRWIDRFGSRELMLLAAIVGSAGLLVLSVATLVQVYFLAWVLIGLSMAGILYTPAFATVYRYNPSASRGAILTISLVAALASTVFVPTSVFLCDWLGWRSALRVLGLVFSMVCIPLAESLPKLNNAPEPKDEVATVQPRDSHPSSFWILTIALTLVETVAVAINAYLVVLLVSHGQSFQAAAAIAGLTGIAKLGGRLSIAAGSRFSSMCLLRWSLLVNALALALPLFWPSTWSLIALVVGFSGTGGARTVLRPAIIAEMFGAKQFGTKNGMLQFYMTLSKSAGPVGLGALVGFTNWQVSLGLLTSTVVVGGVLLLFCVEHKKK